MVVVVTVALCRLMHPCSCLASACRSKRRLHTYTIPPPRQQHP